MIRASTLKADDAARQHLSAASPGWTPAGSTTLRRALVGLDTMALALAWSLVFLPGILRDDGIRSLTTLLVPAVVAVGLWLLTSSRLYRSRISSVRSIEIARLARIAVILGLVAFAMGTAIDHQPRLRAVAAGALVSFALLVLGRGGYRSWLRARRVEGRFLRPVVVVGVDDETLEITRLFATHPELGFSVCGVVGARTEAMALGLGECWLGPLDHAVRAVHDHAATGAIVVTSAVPGPALNAICRDLVDSGRHVHLTSGLHGIDHRRLQSQPLAYEPFLYLEPVALSRGQSVLKRLIDIGITLVTLTLVAPVLVLAAAAIKLEDGGSILFRQRRVGRYGEPFTIFKLRTMVEDAERLVIDLAERNQRDGPLFKLERDPRVTRVGRFLRATSIDELPQLFNVLRGEMSLVGPRPALPSEVAEFDDDLLSRTTVMPGITGLWQVEARDNPSFAAYRRLDLFYVENWSVTFDLVILLATLESEVFRVLARARHGGEADEDLADDPSRVVDLTDQRVGGPATPRSSNPAT